MKTLSRLCHNGVRCAGFVAAFSLAGCAGSGGSVAKSSANSLHGLVGSGIAAQKLVSSVGQTAVSSFAPPEPVSPRVIVLTPVPVNNPTVIFLTAPADFTPAPAPAATITAPVLNLRGTDAPFVPQVRVDNHGYNFPPPPVTP